jgi:aspartate/methionine/tyrosine aminotransferase
MQYSDLVRRITGDGADAWLTHYEALAARERGEQVLILSVGDPDLDTPAPVVERAISALRAGDTHYVQAGGRPALRAAIARRHALRTGQQVTPGEVVVLAGAQNALFVASMCLAGAGDEVISFEPIYPTYPATIEASGARLVRVRQRASAGFRLDLPQLAAAITPRTRAIFLATPNNPSGVIFNEAEIAGIGELAQQHRLWVVADEVYAGLAPGGRVPGLAARLPEQVVTISSLSKSHAMTGWRAGWLVGPRALCAHAEALLLSMVYGLPGFIQAGALSALEIADETEERMRSYCALRRERMRVGLQDIPGLALHEPEAGMFMLVDVSGTGLTGRQFMRALFARERVSVLDGGAFGSETMNCVRICFAADEALLDEGCARIRRFCEQPLA